MVLNSKWAPAPITLSDSLNEPAWVGSNLQKLPVAANIWLYLRNDAHHMYLAIDMPDETNSNPAGDGFWLSFDVNRNGTINPNQDINYTHNSLHPGKIGKQLYLGPNTWTGLSSWPGEYVFDFEGSPKNAAPHKVWKLKIPLADFGINLSTLNVVAWMGLRIILGSRSFEFPAAFYNSGFGTMNTSMLVFARNVVIDPALCGPVIAAVGLIPTAASVIDPATGRATTAPGYYVAANQAAFGGMLNLVFNHNTIATLRAAGASKYKVLYGPPVTPPALPANPLSSAWLNYRWVGDDVVLDAFGPDSGGFYHLPDPASQYSIQDLLIQFDSALLPNGLYQFAVQFFTEGGAPVSSPAQKLVLYIDNTLPTVAINKIYRSADPAKKDVMLISSCDPLTLGHTEGLVFDITATDSDGDIDAISLGWGGGDGSGGPLYSDAFGPSKPTVWTGITNQIVPAAPGSWVPVKSCIYSFSLTAGSRTTNGYGPIGANQVTKMLYIVKS